MTIIFNLTDEAPVYAQIAEQVRLAVAKGQLRPGERLEPVRALARRLGLDPGTVARAYRLLEQQGIIETNRRRGSTIAHDSDAAGLAALRASRLRGLTERALVEALAQGFTPAEIEAAFGLQLAAWRERRANVSDAKVPGTSEVPGTSAGRLNRFAGSHDLALEALWAQVRRGHPEVSFTASYVGSLDGLLALLHGEVGLAGSHMLDEETGEYNLPILRRLFPGQSLCVVTLAERQQGLIVARGNPQGIGGFADLPRPEVRFVNRQPGSGTRALLDHHLHRLGIAPQAVTAYTQVVTTHLAVAAAVAEGRADAGLGLLAAARAYDLDFVPLAKERYDLVLRAEDRARPPLAWLLEVAGSAGFRGVVDELGGYDTARTGEERYLS
jgi:molybdate-binding protein/DNA-binding transcriptional regulator YhcF (GntR family)